MIAMIARGILIQVCMAVLILRKRQCIQRETRLSRSEKELYSISDA